MQELGNNLGQDINTSILVAVKLVRFGIIKNNTLYHVT